MLMDYTDIGRTRLGETTTSGLLFDVTHVAYGSSGFNPGTPGTPLPLNPAATALVAEVYRRDVAPNSIVTESFTATQVQKTVWSTCGGDEFNSIVGEAGLIATITDPGTTGHSVGDEFLLAQAHFGRIVFTIRDRISIPWQLLLNLPTAAGQLGGLVWSAVSAGDGIYAGLSSVGSPVPVGPVNITDPTGLNNLSANIHHYTPDGEHAWTRTLSSTAGGDTHVLGIKLDYPRDAVYFTFIASDAQVFLRDEAGAVLNVFNKAAGTHSTWGGWGAIQLSTGAFMWGQSNGYDAPPVNSFQQARPLHLGMLGTRLYMAGYTRLSALYPQKPTFGGFTYPGSFPTAGWAAGLFVAEVDPLTGNVLSMNTNANPGLLNVARPIATGASIARSHMTMDSVNDRIHLSGGYTGPVDDKEILIGEGSGTEFPTRDFSYWGAGDADTKPFLATFNADLEAQVASTVALDNITTVANNTATNVGRVAVLPDGSLIWPWQNVPSTTATGQTIDRSGGGGSYGGAATLEYTGAQLSSVRISAAHDTPDWDVSLANYPTNSGEGTKEPLAYVHPDGDVVITNVRSRGWTGASNTVSFVGGPISPQEDYQSWLVAQNPVTGALLWQAMLSESAAGVADTRELFTWESGPNTGITISIGMFRPQTYQTDPHGANDPGVGGALVFDVNDSWVSNTVGGEDTAYALIARDKAGNVVPALCMPLGVSDISAITSYPSGIEGY